MRMTQPDKHQRRSLKIKAAFILSVISLCLLAAACTSSKTSPESALPPSPSPVSASSSPGIPETTPPAASSPVPDSSSSVVKPPPGAASPSSPAAPGSADGEPYVLDILGESGKLSSSAWRRMQEWRDDIKEYVKKTDSPLLLNGPDRNAVALTFDDGPDETVTPQILKVLKDKGVTASFFFIGSKVAALPELTRKAFDEGHLILNHSYTHPELTTLSAEDLKAELDKTNDAIRKATGVTPALMRPPYGDTNTQVEQAWSGDNRKLVLWSLDTLDWSLKDRKPIIRNVTEYVRNGEILLMHTTPETEETAAALPQIIDSLLEKGFRIVGLDELLDTPAYIDFAK
jgi:peptidoglycan-N-acetylglucosamine deacetylase